MSLRALAGARALTGRAFQRESGDPEMNGGGWKELVISAGALGLAGWAGWLDWRTRKIPNWLTVPSLVLGLTLSATLGRWPGAKASLEGAGICLGVLLPFVLVRAVGAGDWKLMIALGAFLGLRVLWVLLGTVLIAGLMAVVEVVRQGKVRETFYNLYIILVAYSTFRVNNARVITLDNPGLMKVPFGLAAALSTTLFFVLISAIRFFH